MTAKTLKNWTVTAKQPKKKAAKGKVSTKKKLAARYDSAQTTTENRRHWANADDKTPVNANSPLVRQRLRTRARYEWENNCICSGMISTRSTDIIGYTAPRPQVLTDDSKLNRYIEDEWLRWSECDLVNLPAKLKILDEGKQVEGEHFLAIQQDSEVETVTGYRLGIVPLSANRVCDPSYYNGVVNDPGLLQGLYSDDGVVIDPKTGRAKYYNISSPYEDIQPNYSLTQSKTLVGAKHILHWFTPRRAGQFRGISELTPCLPLFAQLRRYVLAVLTAAETAAMLAGIMKTTAPVAEPVEVSTWTKTELERGTLLSLPDGWDATQFKPEQPIASFEMFIYCLAREIGRALNIPVGVVLGDSSRYNYSSARLDYGWYDEQLRFFRRQLIIRVLDPLFNEWLRELALIDPRVSQFVKLGVKRTWKFERRPSIDPEKDANAAAKRLEIGTSNLAIECANEGLDWNEVLDQQAKENQKKSEISLDNGTNDAIIQGVDATALMALIDKAINSQYPVDAAAIMIQLAFPQADTGMVKSMLDSLYQARKLITPVPSQNGSPIAAA